MGVRSPFDRINKERRVDMGGNPNGATELVDLGLGEAYEVVKYVHDNLHSIQALAALATQVAEIGYAIEHNVYALADHEHDQRYSLISHQHVLTDVTGLVAALAGKQAAGSYAPLVHTHLIADVAGLQAALDTKQGAGNYQAAGNYATLVGGLIPTSQLPALAITKPNLVSSQAQQLALIAEQGDLAIRSDIHQTYMHNGGTSGTMADWTQLQTPTDVVGSVNGQTGTIVLGKADVGLGNVDNTSDADKPVSTAVASALVLKEGVVVAGTVSQYYRGDKTWQTLNKAAVGLSNVDNTSDANKPVSTAQAAAIALKLDASSGINALADVGVSGVINNQFLRYNLATTKWVPATMSMSYISDVDVATNAPTNGQALIWNSTSNKWVPGTVASSGGTGTAPTNRGAWASLVANYVYDFEDGNVPAAFTQTNALSVVADTDGTSAKSITFSGGAAADWSDHDFSFQVVTDATHSTVTIRMKIQCNYWSGAPPEGVFLYVDGVSQGIVTQSVNNETTYTDRTITGLAAGTHTIRVNFHNSAYSNVGAQNIFISQITAPILSSTYVVGDVVSNGGRLWECIVASTGQTPSVTATDWVPLKEKLSELADVDTSTAPTDAQVLAWNTAAGKFKPSTVASSGGSVTAPTQVSARYWGLFDIEAQVGQALVIEAAYFNTVAGAAGITPTAISSGGGTAANLNPGVGGNMDTGSSVPNWIQWDFGAATAPVELKMTSRTDYNLGYTQMPRNMTLCYSNDGVVWSLHSHLTPNFTAIGQTITMAIPTLGVSLNTKNSIGSHRYWALLDLTGQKLGGTGQTANVQLQDVQFYSDAAATTAITQPSFSASSEFDTSGTYAAANLNTVGGTYWAASGTVCKWLKADFTTPVSVAAMKITPITSGNEAPSGFAVAYSDDGTAWTVVSEHTSGAWVASTAKTFVVPTVWPSASGSSGLTKLATTVLTAASASIDFPSIPSGYEDLIIVINGQLSGSADFVVMRANGDATSGNYQYARGVFQTSGLSYSSAAATGFVIGLMGGAVAGAAYADMVEVSVQSYARTTFYKNARGRSTLRSTTASTGMTIEETVADWLSTAAINRLTFIPNSGNFTVGTVITIYGRG